MVNFNAVGHSRILMNHYAYDFLGLLEVGLIGKWNSYLSALLDDDDTAFPSGIFSSQEIIKDNEGELSPGTKAIGTDKIDMVTWVVNMKTPEYLNDHDVVFIANDVTIFPNGVSHENLIMTRKV